MGKKNQLEEIEIIKGTTIKVAGHPVRLGKALVLRPGEPVEFDLDDHTVLPLPDHLCLDEDDGYPD